MLVKFVLVVDYVGVVEVLVVDCLDMVWLGGFIFVQVWLKIGNVIFLVQCEQDQQFISKFIMVDFQVKFLQDLKGKIFVFGLVFFILGSLMLCYFMQKDGIVFEQFFFCVVYFGVYDVIVVWVQVGKVDVGVLNVLVWQKLVDSGKVDIVKVKVFVIMLIYYDYNWIVCGNFDLVLVEKIKQVFFVFDLVKLVDKEIFDLQVVSCFIEINLDNYKGIEEFVCVVGLLK